MTAHAQFVPDSSSGRLQPWTDRLPARSSIPLYTSPAGARRPLAFRAPTRPRSPMRFDQSVPLRSPLPLLSRSRCKCMDLRVAARRRWQGALAVDATGMTLMKRVLIVEDDADLRDMMATLLDLEGFETVAAPNGDAALELLDPRLDAIVLDLMMPVMDGWEFRRRQLSHPRVADIPVIVVSAVHVQREGGTVACAAHLSKPIDFDRLIRTLASVCRMAADA